VCGLAQGANGVSSYEHWKETDCSLAVNSNRAVREVELAGGPAVKLTSGASVSGGGGGAVVSVGAVGIGVAVTVAVVVAAAGGDVRFGFGFGVGFGVAGARGCVVAAWFSVLGAAVIVGCVAVGAGAEAAEVVAVVVLVVFAAWVGGRTAVRGLVGVGTAVAVGGLDAETVVGAGAAARIVRPRSVAVPTPLATRSTAAPAATATAVVPRGRPSLASRPAGRQYPVRSSSLSVAARASSVDIPSGGRSSAR
jgi:hypothetical protein